MPEAGRIIVFGGPSLPWRLPRAGSATQDYDLRPPARRGDFLNAIPDRPGAIVLLDGYYYDVLAAGHKEILLALESGIPVLGAASLGALRAVELQRFGMVGSGQIFRWFRDGLVDGDDEVAVLHLQEEHGYRPTTIALVDLRVALRRLRQHSRVPAAASADLLAAFKAIGFVERLPDRLRAIARLHLGEGGARELLAEIARTSLKHRDAFRALIDARRLVAEASSSPRQRRSPRRLRRPWPSGTPTTEFLAWDLDRFLSLRSGQLRGVELRKLFYATVLLHPSAKNLIRSIARRQLLAVAAARSELRWSRARESEVRRTLSHNLARTLGYLPLPPIELAAEARQRVLADSAREAMGEEAAQAVAAGWLGLQPVGSSDGSIEFAALASDLFLPWSYVRAVLCSELALPAHAAACAAEAVDRCFARWARGSRLAAREVERLSCDLLGCRGDEIERETIERALFRVVNPGPSLDEGVRWLAAAERLPLPINGYPAARDGLRQASFDSAVDPVSGRRGVPPLQTAMLAVPGAGAVR